MVASSFLDPSSCSIISAKDTATASMMMMMLMATNFEKPLDQFGIEDGQLRKSFDENSACVMSLIRTLKVIDFAILIKEYC